MGSRESWSVTSQMVADFARAICDALLMLVGTALTLVVVAGYAAYVVLVYWWRQLIVAAALVPIATTIVHMC